MDYILGHKANLHKFNSIEIISGIFSDHNDMKLEINHRKRNEKKKTSTWRLDNMLSQNQNHNGKMGKRPELTFLQRRYMDSQHAHGMLYNTDS